MKVLHKKDVPHVNKPEETSVDYYLRKEYELHSNKQAPKSTQAWHHHEHIFESLFIIEGELTAKWKTKDEKIIQKLIRKGDLIEVENTPHTFINHTNKIVKFIVIKQVLSGKSKRKLFKTDKIIDE